MSLVWHETESGDELLAKWQRLRMADKRARQFRNVLIGQSLIIAALVYALYWSLSLK